LLSGERVGYERIDENAEISAKTLPQVKMPNRDGFIDMSRK